MNTLIKKTFENRGYSDEFLNEIESDDYSLLNDIDVMAKRLREIHDAQTPLTILPDFDMDGISAGTLAYAGLSELGFDVSLYIPDPSKGYGFNAETIKDLMSKHPDTRTIISCDTGISCYEGIDYCKAHDIEILITDHHLQDEVSNADITIDPCRLDDDYEHKAICGAFVIWQVLMYYADKYCGRLMQKQIKRLRVFAGIGTVSDSMPVLYENRSLIRDCVSILKELFDTGSTYFKTLKGCSRYKHSFLGLWHLLKLFQHHEKIKSRDDINEEFLGFYLSPAFNAVKRMEGDMSKSFGVFFGSNQDKDAEYLYETNELRKKAVEEEMDKLLSSKQPYAPYIYISEARSGLLGLLAMKLLEMNGIPTLVLNDKSGCMEGPFAGSGRSPEWYPFRSRTKGILETAGHECAFGCSIPNIGTFGTALAFLINDINDAYDEADITESIPDFVISTDGTGDTGINPVLFSGYLKEIENYRPFGNGFPQPNILFVFNPKETCCQLIGQERQHIKIPFPGDFSVLLWNQADKLKDLREAESAEVIGRLGISEFRGTKSINFSGNLLI